jgi:tripartite-type tricarboxylate transporter receptor subunit TctC
MGSIDSIAGYIKSGELIPVVVLGKKRLPEIPDVPTIGEAGYPELAGLGGRRLLAAAPGLPPEIRQTLEAAVKAAVDDPDFQKWLKDIGRSTNYYDAKNTEEWVTENVKSLEKHKDILGQYMKKE